jgi:hypothetical protein
MQLLELWVCNWPYNVDVYYTPAAVAAGHLIKTKEDNLCQRV